MTSSDRHAEHDSHYRNGQHVPLGQNRNSHGNTSSASESRTDLNGSYDVEAQHGFVSNNSNNGGRDSPSSPYSPTNNRSSLQRQGGGGSGSIDNKMADVDAGEIQMQSFADGLPPPPPVNHSWKRIDAWLEVNYEELFENTCEGATANDINELESQLDCTLPTEVRESIAIHDGQERGGLPTGVLFGCMLLDCEEIMQEWQQWRTVNEAYFGETRYEIPQALPKAFAGSSSSSAIPVAQPAQSNNPHWRQELLDKQDSQPDKAIQKTYSHPAWIPLARDWGGNNICVDLAPGPTGKWGQVILMGRDYDCKYVISRSWSAFLATVADDMNTDKWFIDEDSKELKLREFKQQGVEPAYIDILRWRADQKFGRKIPRKGPLRINSNVGGAGAPAGGHGGMNGLSPYSSPTHDDRGRSPNRYSNGKAPMTNSPKMGISSPLARVQEETTTTSSSASNNNNPSSSLSQINTSTTDFASSDSATKRKEKLVDVATPISAKNSDEFERRGSLPKSRLGGSVLNSEDLSANADSQAKSSSDDPAAQGGAEEMKTVEI